MADIAQLRSPNIALSSRQIQESYDAFKAKGLRLNLTRGKPSPEQMDLSSELLALPGATDYVAEDGTDCRNYCGLQGIPEARSLFSGIWAPRRNKSSSAIIPVWR